MQPVGKDAPNDGLVTASTSQTKMSQCDEEGGDEETEQGMLEDTSPQPTLQHMCGYMRLYMLLSISYMYA